MEFFNEGIIDGAKNGHFIWENKDCRHSPCELSAPCPSLPPPPPPNDGDGGDDDSGEGDGKDSGGIDVPDNFPEQSPLVRGKLPTSVRHFL